LSGLVLSGTFTLALCTPLTAHAIHPLDHYQSFSLHHCPQAMLSPALHIRIAEPEDFDDLRPIFNSQSDVLRSR
jgi:hypothetical protein